MRIRPVILVAAIFVCAWCAGPSLGRVLINAPPLTSRLQDQFPLSGTKRKCDHRKLAADEVIE